MRILHSAVSVAMILTFMGCNSQPADETAERQRDPIAPAADTVETDPPEAKVDPINTDPIEEVDAPMKTDPADDDWQKTWDARLAVLEKEFGPSDDQKIFTSPVPIYLGGNADVLLFRNHVKGVGYVTAGLIGDGRQEATEIGEYELMMCSRQENDWMPSLLSRLAPYTFQVPLRPDETMDIAPAMPEGSTIAALLFVAYRQFEVNDTAAGVLLCIGITAEELEECRADGPSAVLARLKENGVFPFTDTHRDSALPQ